MNSTQRHTILVVDDEPAVVESVQDLLRLDHRVLGATRATEALEILAHDQVHVVMTDQCMPDMTGVQFLHRIREEHPEVMRLIFTGYADIHAVIDAINEGHVYRYITKPWDSRELQTIIREAVERYDLSAAMKERLFFESALRRYLAGPLVEELIHDPSRLRLGGEKRKVSVLFFDIVGFTTIAEDLPVEELVHLVNGYLDELVEVIFRENGTLDKFIGDAVMAFWGAPLRQADHPNRVCRAAVGMQHALHHFASMQADPTLSNLRGRVGVHTGVAALGNLGSSSIMNYTVMGDTVNIASRLEGLNKVYGTQIIASEETVKQADWPAKREIDCVRVSGRTKPIKIYELWGIEDQPPVEALEAYAEGLTLYRARNFVDARAVFEQACVLGDHSSGPAMVAYVNELVTAPLPPNWDGVRNFLRH